MLTIDNIDNALRNAYLPVIQSQLNNIDPFISSIEKTTRDVYGKEILVLVEKDNGKFHTLKSELATIEVNFEFSDKAIKAAHKSASAFVNMVNDEVESAVCFTQSETQNLIYGDGHLTNFNGLKKFFNKKEDNPTLNPRTFIVEKYDFKYIRDLVNAENEDINFMICSPATKRIFMDTTFDKDVKVIDSICGYKSVAFTDSILIFTYKYVTDDEIWFVNSRDFKIHELCDWEWLENKDGKILAKDKKTGLWKATLIKFMNLVCHNPNNQIKIILK